MNAAEISYLPEQPEHDASVEAINAEAFGPGRFARAAYRIREGGPHDRSLSFVALAGDEIVGSVRQTWVAAGSARAILLGPLAVRPTWKNRGIGKRLVAIAAEAAREAGAAMVILVGDQPYYGSLGFEVFPKGRIRMPRPVDPDRLLVSVFDRTALDAFCGDIVHANCAKDRECEPIGLRGTTSNQAPEAAGRDQENRRKAVRG